MMTPYPLKTTLTKVKDLSPLPQPGSNLSDPVGIGLRAPHYQDILETKPALGWMEVHPENYFGGGVHRHYLSKIREHYPLSFHAVGLSLGAAQPVDPTHLQKIKELIDVFDPFQVSDHASWSANGNAHLNDLLPLPYTEESLRALCENIDRTQNTLGRRILVENPSTYMAFAANEMNEFEFMNEAAKRSGCGLLLDINNIYVQAHNHGFDPYEYINGIDLALPYELHLAGHIEKDIAPDTSLLIDTHSRPVCGDVWDLYAFALKRFGPVPTVIEWDAELPDLSVLMEEAARARAYLHEKVPYAAE